MPDESTSIAVMDSPAPASIPTVTEAPSMPATIATAETPRQSAVTADMIPRSYSQPTAPKYAKGDQEPERLTSDKSKVSPEWQQWLAAQHATPQLDEDQPEPAPAELAEFGLNLPEIKSALTSIGRMYQSIEGVADALGEVYNADQTTYYNAFNVLLASDPAYALGYLQQLGEVPQDFGDPLPENTLPADLAYAIPEDLHSTARGLAPAVLRQWAQQGVGHLVYELDKQEQLNQLVITERERVTQQWDEALDRAEQTGRSQLAELNNLYLNAHAEQLERWQPTRSERVNRLLQTVAFYGAQTDLLSDQKFSALREHINFWTLNGPTYRVYGQHEKADEGERTARMYAAQFNTRLGQLIKSGIQFLTAEISPAFKGNEPEPEEKPDPAPPTLKNGKTSPEYLAWVTRQAEKRAAAAKR